MLLDVIPVDSKDWKKKQFVESEFIQQKYSQGMNNQDVLFVWGSDITIPLFTLYVLLFACVPTDRMTTTV